MLPCSQIRRQALCALFAAMLGTASANPQQRPRPQTVVDLKPLGAASDLFTDQNDSKYPQRGVINLFWLGSERIAVAFSTNHRWSNTESPEPLHVRLIVFDTSGRQQNTRDWKFTAEGPAAESTLDFAPGPGGSILAAHETSVPQAGRIPEGNFLQVLKPDTSLEQAFYVPATGSYIPNISSDPELVLENFYADKHTSLTWWSGLPLKAGRKLDLPADSAETLVGPGAAARASCQTRTLCSGIRIFRVGAPEWFYNNPTIDTFPIPRALLDANSLVVELRREGDKQVQLVLARANGSHSPLPAIPKGLQVLGVTAVGSKGQRLSLIAAGERGVCGSFDIWCRQVTQTLVIDLPSNKIVFQQELSPAGGTAVLSPDGRHLAILDRNKLTTYEVP